MQRDEPSLSTEEVLAGAAAAAAVCIPAGSGGPAAGFGCSLATGPVCVAIVNEVGRRHAACEQTNEAGEACEGEKRQSRTKSRGERKRDKEDGES